MSDQVVLTIEFEITPKIKFSIDILLFIFLLKI